MLGGGAESASVINFAGALALMFNILSATTSMDR